MQGKPLVWLAMTLCCVLVPMKLTTACDRTESALEDVSLSRSSVKFQGGVNSVNQVNEEFQMSYVKESGRSGACQHLRPEKIPPHTLKLVNVSPLFMTKVSFKLLPLCWDSERAQPEFPIALCLS